jgi:hypothetical protein
MSHPKDKENVNIAGVSSVFLVFPNQIFPAMCGFLPQTNLFDAKYKDLQWGIVSSKINGTKRYSLTSCTNFSALILAAWLVKN